MTNNTHEAAHTPGPREVEQALRALITEADETGGHTRTVSRYTVDKARAIIDQIDAQARGTVDVTDDQHTE